MTTLDINEVFTDILFGEINKNYADVYDRCLRTTIDRFFREVLEVLVRFGDNMRMLS